MTDKLYCFRLLAKLVDPDFGVLLHFQLGKAATENNNCLITKVVVAVKNYKCAPFRLLNIYTLNDFSVYC